MTRIEKTVYVIGGGFSRDAGFPLQAQILSRIKSFDIDLMTSPRHSVESFQPAREMLLAFLVDVFPAGVECTLEDVYTLLDHCIARRQSCAGRTWRDLDKLRDCLNTTILFVFHQARQSIKDHHARLYKAIGAHVIERRLGNASGTGALSVVSLNWDTLLEDSIYEILHDIGACGVVDVDYCCFTTPLRIESPHTPSLWQKAKGIMNIKILKLHGSANWLMCPNLSPAPKHLPDLALKS